MLGILNHAPVFNVYDQYIISNFTTNSDTDSEKVSVASPEMATSLPA
jgi:hypothetical protein